MVCIHSAEMKKKKHSLQYHNCVFSSADGEVASDRVSGALLESVDVQGLLGSYGQRPLPLIILSSSRVNCLF